MFNTIRSKILLLIIGIIVTTSMTFLLITAKKYQTETTSQSQRLANETLESVIRAIDAEYDDQSAYEINAIKNQRSLMRDVGASILSMVDSFYDQQKSGLLTEQLAKELCLKRLKEFRYQGDNYFFVCDASLTGLSHPDKEMVGKKWSEFEDIKKRSALSLIQKIIKTRGKTFTVFMWPRPEDMKQVKQLGFFLYYPQWEWIIGTAYQIGDIEKKSLAQEEHIFSKLKKILGQMSINTFGGILILGEDGKTVFHSSHLKHIDLNKIETTLNKTISGYLGKTTDNFRNPIEYQYTDQTQRKITQTAYIQYYKYLNWHIVSFIDNSESEKPGHIIEAQQYALLLIILAIGIAIAIFISKKITYPLVLLSQYSKDLPNIDFQVKDHSLLESIKSKNYSGEIKLLANAFTFMESELEKYIRELKNHQENLTKTVIARTEELSDTNRDLKNEIAERKQAEDLLIKAHDQLEKRVEERTFELQKINKQLLHSEKLAAIGGLSASIAHEFNNPLQGIMTVIKGVKRRTRMDVEDMKLFDMAIQECGRMKDLINSLQDFNRPSSSKIAPMNIHTAIDSLLMLIRKEFHIKNIRVITHYAEDMVLVKAVGDQIKQVILNLLNNGAYACEGGGKITISTEVISKENISIKIQDSGKGIKPEHIDKIFNPFFTTKPTRKGTGLGLSVSYGIIKKHGGRIEVESEPDKGATFTIILPIEGVETA